jgi:hypothetical protein
MYQAFNDYSNYNYWNHQRNDDLNHRLNKMHLHHPNSLYYSNSNRSYEINPETVYAAPVSTVVYDLNDYNIYKHGGFYANDHIYQPYNSFNKNYSIHNDMINGYSAYEIWNYQNEMKMTNVGIANSINDENEHEEWSDYSDSDNLEEYNRLLNKKKNEETSKRLERNQGCLSILLEGDLIEYLENENDLDERDVTRYWAIYMGQSMIMRFDNKRKLVVYESYWKIANEYYIFINRDLDKKFIVLPIYEILKRARHAHANSGVTSMSKLFSSDRNFAMWCRFDINKSDIELATDNGKYSAKLAKEFLFKRFFESIESYRKKK